MAFGFARSLDGDVALTVVPRLFAKAAGEEASFPVGPFWEDTTLRLPEPRPFTDAFTGREFPAENVVYLKEIFRDFPFALLTSKTASPPSSAVPE
jgi:(1->4)-alpha-D-glucan 1-alpha-D-glucosylmutase